MITCREALNTPGFAAWLVRNCPDHNSLDYGNPADQERIAQWFVSRLACKEAAPGMRQMYRDTFLADTGVSLSNYALSAVDKYLDKLAIENPEGAAYYSAKIRRWMEIPREIKRLEEAYANAGGSDRREEAGVEHEAVSQSHDLRRNASRFAFRRSYAEQRVMKYSVAEWRDRLLELEVELDKFAKLDRQIIALKKERWDLKREFFTIMDIVNALLVEIRMTVAQKLIAMTAGWRKRSMEELEAAQNYFEKVLATGAEFGLDYLSDIASSEGFQKNLDDAVRGSLYEDLKKRMVRQYKKPDALELRSVESMIKQALTRKQLGSLRDDQAREAVIEVLQDLDRDAAISDVHKFLMRQARQTLLPTTP